VRPYHHENTADGDDTGMAASDAAVGDSQRTRTSSRAFWYGCAVVVAAGFVLSLGAFAIRAATQIDALQYLFWRALGFTIALGLAAWIRDHRSPVAQVIGLGRFGWLAALAMVVSQITFVSAVKTATFAEVFFLCSLAPLMAAVLARPLLGERMGWLGVGALAMGLAGVTAMTGGGGLIEGSLSRSIRSRPVAPVRRTATRR
jgi:drug/metabolite transporter (DMT)-like permease